MREIKVGGDKAGYLRAVHFDTRGKGPDDSSSNWQG